MAAEPSPASAAAPVARPAAGRQATPSDPTPAGSAGAAGGIRNALRLAYRPLTLREDLALLPRLLANKAFWLPVLIAAAISGGVIAFQGRELISRYAFQYFVFPPPIGSIFLAGYLAPRASYLIGAAVGIVTSVLFALVVMAAPAPEGVQAGATFLDALFYGLATAPLAGAFVAAGAAWYRRLLYHVSPARRLEAERRAAASRGKAARAR